ncbi:Mrp ATPases involved in chromosome partitioning [Comamonadaceae bacterium]
MALFSSSKRAHASQPPAIDTRLQPLTQGCLADPKLARYLASDEAFHCFRALDSELLLELGEREFQVMVTSVSAAEGRSTVSLVLAALSAAYASDQRVLYVDASDSHAHTRRLFGDAQEQPGLYDFMHGEATFDSVLGATPLNNFHFVAACSAKLGRKMFDPARFDAFLREARQRFERIVVDGPALETHREALSMARSVGNTLLVLRARRTPRARATLALRDLHGVGAKVLGSVLNDRVFPIPGSRPGR